MQQEKWWENFFSGFWLDVQRQIWPAEHTRSEADCIEQLLQLTPQAHVLDVPCGEGRLSLELASRGYQVTGVDLCLPLLSDARRKAEEQKLNVTWEQRDMRDLHWQERFDGALCFWRSFGYFDDEENDLSFLKAVSVALKPGARFLLDVHCAEALFPMYEEQEWRRFGELWVLEERYYDHVRSRNEVEWTFIKEGKIENKKTSVRIYTYRELVQLLAAANFTHCEGYGSLAGNPFKLGAQRLLLVAVRA